MIIDCNTFEKTEKFEADICILGAGISGTVLANELKNSFKMILLIEAGGKNYEVESYSHVSHLKMLGGTSNNWRNNTSRISPIDFKKRDWVESSGWPIE